MKTIGQLLGLFGASITFSVLMDACRGLSSYPLMSIAGVILLDALAYALIKYGGKESWLYFGPIF